MILASSILVSYYRIKYYTEPLSSTNIQNKPATSQPYTCGIKTGIALGLVCAIRNRFSRVIKSPSREEDLGDTQDRFRESGLGLDGAVIDS